MQRTVLSVATASTVCLRCRILTGGPSISPPLQCIVAISRVRVVPASRTYRASNSARSISTSITGLSQTSPSSLSSPSSTSTSTSSTSSSSSSSLSSSSSSPSSSSPSSSSAAASPSPPLSSSVSASSSPSLPQPQPPQPSLQPSSSSVQSASSAANLKRSTNWRAGWFEGNHRAFIHAGVNGGGECKEMAAEGDSSQRVERVHIQEPGRDREGLKGSCERPEKQVKAETEVEVEMEKRATVQAANQAAEVKGEQAHAQGDIETTIEKPLHRDHEPPDERTVNLGTTIRTLQSCLPTLLSSPSSLPTSTLSPNINLHLFPSSHPNLPTARGRVAYKTALWTAPFVWGQLPGRVRLEILAAQVVKPCEQGEQLRVRWRAVSPTFSSSSSSTHSSSSSSTHLSTPKKAVGDGEGTSPAHPNLFPANKGETGGGFTGLFIFTFDDKGRILSHTIEHADEGWRTGEDKAGEAGLGFLGVAEWLLKKAKEATAGEGVGGRKRTEPGYVFLREPKRQEKDQEWRRE